jgi:hypothetical protein
MDWKITSSSKDDYVGENPTTLTIGGENNETTQSKMPKM